ncbi:thymidylate synthase [Brevibacillus migulae]|uniref:thymidylate synthase n=1 Tax=Brevibacillus migulae TaxID=1644114 RepID=UPI00106DFB2B|nr:thymidylate synthase [Brevibacillus migulae]
MNAADRQYLSLISDVLENGYSDQNRTGIPTKKLFGRSFTFDLRNEFPILTTKQVFFKTAVKELLWIYQLQSNDVGKLREMGVTVWDEWAREDGTIGKAYGYQIRKHRQIDKLIEGLQKDPQGRRHIMSLWDMNDLEDMALQPCAFMTMWDVSDGYLNCTLVQRSADLGLGVPFNFTQYAVLVHMIAQVTGLKPGMFIHFLNNAHIYENHEAALREQMKREPYAAPKLWLNPEITNFYDFTVDDIKLLDYQHHPKLEMEVAV